VDGKLLHLHAPPAVNGSRQFGLTDPNIDALERTRESATFRTIRIGMEVVSEGMRAAETLETPYLSSVQSTNRPRLDFPQAHALACPKAEGDAWT